LTDPQVLDIYGRILRGGLAGDPAARVPQNPDRSTVVVEMVAHERRSVGVHPIADSPAAGALADRLIRLARVRPRPDAEG
ncbi:MAG: hypothetical protein AAGF47_01135, partial [Planctomycetota bacterium]